MQIRSNGCRNCSTAVRTKISQHLPRSFWSFHHNFAIASRNRQFRSETVDKTFVKERGSEKESASLEGATQLQETTEHPCATNSDSFGRQRSNRLILDR